MWQNGSFQNWRERVGSIYCWDHCGNAMQQKQMEVLT